VTTLAVTDWPAIRTTLSDQIVATPTTPQVAFPHGASIPVNQADFTVPANAAGLPAVSVPLPTDDLPAGLQFIGPHFAEATLIRLAVMGQFE